MAVVQIANIYNPATFARRAQLAQTRLNRFSASGIVVADALLAAQFAGGGHVGEITHMPALTVSEPNYSTDVAANKSTPMNIACGKQRVRGAMRNASWSTMDLARDLALQDPVEAVTNRIGHYWAADDEQRIIKSAHGIYLGNIANNSGDMRIDIGTDAVGAAADAEKIGGSAVVDALQTLGDHSFKIDTLVMHSVCYASLQKQKLIEYVKKAETSIAIPTYLGKQVVVDDSCTAISGTNRIKYTTMLFGGNVFGSAPMRVQVPSEMKRDPDAGVGGGQDTIYSRVSNVLHPFGFDFTSTTVTGQSATYAELALAANWARVAPRKNIALAFLVTNG